MFTPTLPRRPEFPGSGRATRRTRHPHVLVTAAVLAVVGLTSLAQGAVAHAATLPGLAPCQHSGFEQPKDGTASCTYPNGGGVASPADHYVLVDVRSSITANGRERTRIYREPLTVVNGYVSYVQVAAGANANVLTQDSEAVVDTTTGLIARNYTAGIGLGALMENVAPWSEPVVRDVRIQREGKRVRVSGVLPTYGGAVGKPELRYCPGQTTICDVTRPSYLRRSGDLERFAFVLSASSVPATGSAVKNLWLQTKAHVPMRYGYIVIPAGAESPPLAPVPFAVGTGTSTVENFSAAITLRVRRVGQRLDVKALGPETTNVSAVVPFRRRLAQELFSLGGSSGIAGLQLQVQQAASYYDIASGKLITTQVWAPMTVTGGVTEETVKVRGRWVTRAWFEFRWFALSSPFAGITVPGERAVMTNQLYVVLRGHRYLVATRPGVYPSGF